MLLQSFLISMCHLYHITPGFTTPHLLWYNSRDAPVAQWIRASVFGTEGRGFEPLRVYQKNKPQRGLIFLFKPLRVHYKKAGNLARRNKCPIRIPSTSPHRKVRMS